MAGSNYVAYNIAQSRSDSEQAQARNNIGAAALLSLAPAFSTSTAYNEGDVVTYNGALYIFDTAHAAGAWTGADAHETNIMEVLAMAAGATEKKKFILSGPTSPEYTFANNARTAQFSPSSDAAIATQVVSQDYALAGFKVGKKAVIKRMKMRSLAANGLVSSQISAALLKMQLIAVNNLGASVQAYNELKYNIVINEWNRWEYKDEDLQIPDTLPSGAVAFMLVLLSTSEFYVDDFNLQSAYNGQKVNPALLFEVETDKMVNVLNSTDIE